MLLYRCLLLAAGALIPVCLAEKLSPQDLIEQVRRNHNSPAIAGTLVDSLGDDAIKKGIAVAAHGGTFLFVVDAAAEPALYVDDQEANQMRQVKQSSLWIYLTQVREGTAHSFYYMIQGKRFGGKTDVPAYLPECYPQLGVTQGKLSEKRVHSSQIYPGMKSDYWTYLPAAYDPQKPAGVMVWQDGESHINRSGPAHTLTVVDNLTQQKKIPVLVHVFISPGAVGDQKMRSIEYDTVSERYALFLRDEVLAEIGAQYNLRKDAYSHAIAGQSSGGVCAFTAAWFHPELFSRVLSHIGSFTSIQWKPGEIDGGNIYPFSVRKDPKRNIRIWLQDGMEDLETSHGSWPLQNIQLANSLKLMGYDYHFSFSSGTHSGAHGNAELPRSLTWLWRAYDSAKTDEQFVQEPAEREKPLYRVRITNRE
jgi:enterochelin esterase-like enzyme